MQMDTINKGSLVLMKDAYNTNQDVCLVPLFILISVRFKYPL